MQDNVINFEEALEEKDEALEKARKETLFYQKKYFGCLKDKEAIQEINKAMEKIIKQIVQE